MAATGQDPKGSNFWDFLIWVLKRPERTLWALFTLVGVGFIADVLDWHWPTFGVLAGISAVWKKFAG